MHMVVVELGCTWVVEHMVVMVELGCTWWSWLSLGAHGGHG